MLGPTTIASVCGAQAIHVTFLLLALHLMKGDPNYVRWPSHEVDFIRWWEIGDNWETTVIFTMVCTQFATAAVVFSFGGKYRRVIFRNYRLVLSYACITAFLSFLMLSPSNVVTKAFHMASEAFNSPHPESPVWQRYQASGGQSSPAMSVALRVKVLLLALSSSIFVVAWELVVVRVICSLYT